MIGGEEFDSGLLKGSLECGDQKKNRKKIIEALLSL